MKKFTTSSLTIRSLKYKLNRIALLIALTIQAFVAHGQKDGLPDSLVFRIYRNKLVLYADNGFNTAPFSINFKDSIGGRTRNYYRNNIRNTIGIGFSYKWMALRLAFNLPGHLKSESKYGKTAYFDLGFEFKTKRRYFDFDIHNYRGYALKNAYTWNDSLDQFANPHLHMAQVNSFSTSLNTWKFKNKNIKMAAIKGKTGLYLRRQYSFYIKTTLNIYGVSNVAQLVPIERQNPKVSRTGAYTLSAVDLGWIPGMLFVDRYKYFQYCAMLGVGGVIQAKIYNIASGSRSFVGLAPRVDFRLLCGFNRPDWFLMLVTEFDNKSIRFGDMRYAQTFYGVRLVGGIRL